MNVPHGTTSDKSPGEERHAVFAASVERYDVPLLKDFIRSLPGLVPDAPPGTVLLKPNLLAPKPPESAVVTHPALVRAVAEVFLEAGWRVRIGDSAAFAPAAAVMRAAGYDEFIDDLGLERADLSEPVETRGRIFKKIVLAKDVLEADLVINLPKFKTHAQTGLTLAVKNLFGCVPGLRKARWHLSTGHDARLFSLLLLDIAYLVQPHYSIIDAIEAMEGRGPSGGRPRPLGALLGGRDPFTLDAAAAGLAGAGPEHLTTWKWAREFPGLAGAGTPSPAPTPAKGFRLPEPAPDFELIPPEALARPRLFPSALWGILRNLVAPFPAVSGDACTLCETCVDVCPANALSVPERGGEGTLSIDYRRCIRCFCCEEVCPEGAMQAKTPFLGRILRGGG